MLFGYESMCGTVAGTEGAELTPRWRYMVAVNYTAARNEISIVARRKFIGWASRLVLYLLLLFGTQIALALTQTPVVHIGTDGNYVLSNHFLYFEDTTATLNLSDILKPEVQAKFIPVAQGPTSTNFGATNSAIWLQVQLQTESGTPKQWMLEIANPPMDRLDIYVAGANGILEHQIGGDSLPFAQRAVAHHNHVKPIDLNPGSISTLYVRAESQGVVVLPTTLWQPAALWHDDQKSYSIFSLYLGLLTGLLLYNLLLFASVRDPAYLIYSAMVGCIGLSVIAAEGFGAQYLWQQSVWWNNRSPLVFQTGTGAFSILFVRSYLGSKATLPRLDRWMCGLVFFWILAFLSSLFLPYKVGRDMLALLSLAGIVVVIWTTVESIRQHRPGARYFGLAWTALLAGVAVQILHNTGLIASGPIAANAVEIGSALEVVLL